ncbi:MAG: FAD-monooxygenase [Porticoccaceae bacterium]|nr:FAD-monooxygenase [Porticoccaceae bacterium]
MSVTSTQVLVVGGGPVGMMVARTLGHFGVECMLVERNETTTTHPKMDITNARSMELFRRVGLADGLRAVAVPDGNPFDVSWITTLTGHELHRFVYPGADGARQQIAEQNDGSQPSEPPMRVSQVLIEPVLREAIEGHPSVDVHFGCAFESLENTGDGVLATLRTSAGQLKTVHARYLVACDGGGSLVRKQLDISLSGQARVSQRFITHFRSDARDLLQRWGKAWHYQSNRGTLVAQNDVDTWTLLSRFPENTEPEDINPSQLISDFVGKDIDHEVLVANAWTPHLLVADRYRDGNVFLAGDSAHQYIPTGGYGMNTGIGDAFDIAWKLAAVLHGWGGKTLLDAYENERQPVGIANCRGAARHNAVRVKIAELYSPLLGDEGPDADAERHRVGAEIARIGNAENECVGLELGYIYADSPVICHDGDHEFSDDPRIYRPTTTPGARLPSVILSSGENIYQRLGQWFTLLCTQPCETSGFEQVAAAHKLPLSVVDISNERVAGVYRTPAILVRPDHHVAWRGHPDMTTETIEQVIRRVSGL